MRLRLIKTTLHVNRHRWIQIGFRCSTICLNIIISSSSVAAHFFTIQPFTDNRYNDNNNNENNDNYNDNNNNNNNDNDNNNNYHNNNNNTDDNDNNNKTV